MPSYEDQVRDEIRELWSAESGMLDRAKEAALKPLDKAGDAALKTRAGDAIKQGMTTLLESIQQGAWMTTRPEAILKEYKEKGHAIGELSQARALSLKAIDEACSGINTKYKALAAGEGVAAGVAGAAGLAVDVPAVLLMSLRAIGEYALYHGIDPSQDRERVFALRVLAAATAPTVAAKRDALQEVTKASERLEGKIDRGDGDAGVVTAESIEALVEMLVVRLVRTKLAQSIPVLGAAIGAGFNVSTLHAVTKVARLSYHDRHLMQATAPASSV